MSAGETSTAVVKGLGINKGYNMHTDTGTRGVTCISLDDSGTWRTEILR